MNNIQKIKMCDDCGYDEHGNFDLTFCCDYCHGRKTCEICADELTENGFVCPDCWEDHKCIKRCQNCPPDTAEWMCRDCIGYRLWSQTDDKHDDSHIMPDVDCIQKNMYNKICDLKKSIKEGATFEMDGKYYYALETSGQNIKG